MDFAFAPGQVFDSSMPLKPSALTQFAGIATLSLSLSGEAQDKGPKAPQKKIIDQTRRDAELMFRAAELPISAIEAYDFPEDGKKQGMKVTVELRQDAFGEKWADKLYLEVKMEGVLEKWEIGNLKMFKNTPEGRKQYDRIARIGDEENRFYLAGMEPAAYSLDIYLRNPDPKAEEKDRTKALESLKKPNALRTFGMARQVWLHDAPKAEKE